MESRTWQDIKLTDKIGTYQDQEIRKAVSKNKLLYDHSKFNETIEILIKTLDRFDRFYRVFAQ